VRSLFNKVWERIRTQNLVHVQGQNRNVVVRYKRQYSADNNEWGDFQSHRKVLGLISIGKCVDHEEFADLFENYKKVSLVVDVFYLTYSCKLWVEPRAATTP
jgi:hypothetical protein